MHCLPIIYTCVAPTHLALRAAALGGGLADGAAPGAHGQLGDGGHALLRRVLGLQRAHHAIQPRRLLLVHQLLVPASAASGPLCLLLLYLASSAPTARARRAASSSSASSLYLRPFRSGRCVYCSCTCPPARPPRAPGAPPPCRLPAPCTCARREQCVCCVYCNCNVAPAYIGRAAVSTGIVFVLQRAHPARQAFRRISTCQLLVPAPVTETDWPEPVTCSCSLNKQGSSAGGCSMSLCRHCELK